MPARGNTFQVKDSPGAGWKHLSKTFLDGRDVGEDKHVSHDVSLFLDFQKTLQERSLSVASFHLGVPVHSADKGPHLEKACWMPSLFLTSRGGNRFQMARLSEAFHLHKRKGGSHFC